ncbi:hypothetical protein KC8_17785 [Sphingomonas sp. KC8]|nr:hypothetical protein KC8_17785 [Sphingomonas sp. KC8]
MARARACLGARFRPQGRSVADGMDCIGLAGIALGISELPRDYVLRSTGAKRVRAFAEAAGLRLIAADTAKAGDVLMAETGPGLIHLLVLTGTGFIHADAGLRRVVETPGRPPWPVLAAWRQD